MFLIDDNEFNDLKEVINYIEENYSEDVIGQYWWNEGKSNFLNSNANEDDFLTWLDTCGYPVDVV